MYHSIYDYIDVRIYVCSTYVVMYIIMQVYTSVYIKLFEDESMYVCISKDKCVNVLCMHTLTCRMYIDLN